MYHRVASLAHDPWDLAVEPRNFAAQLAILRRERTVVPLGDLVARHLSGKSTGNMAAITFDDGYVDVLANARPALAAAGCPATVFIPTGLVGRHERFWWDTITHVFLEQPSLPDTLTMTMDGTKRTWRLADREADDGETRRAVQMDVWTHLISLDRETRDRLIEELADWAGTSSKSDGTDRCVTREELQHLSEPGFIDLGAHSRFHPSLPTLQPESLSQEVSGSVDDLRDFLGREPTGFAYPFGHFNAACAHAVDTSGVAFACSTAFASVCANEDAFTLPRLMVKNLDSGQFETWLWWVSRTMDVQTADGEQS